jgi:hypothetical protein
MVRLIALFETGQGLNLIANFEGLKLATQRRIHIHGLLDRFLFGTRAKIEPPHHFPTGRPCKFAQRNQILLIDDAHFFLRPRRRSAGRQIFRVIRHVAPDDESTRADSNCDKGSPSGVLYAEEIRLSHRGLLVTKTNKIWRNPVQNRVRSGLDRYHCPHSRHGPAIANRQAIRKSK